MENNKVEQKSSHAEREERILSFWQKNDIFKKSLKKDSPKGDFIFYDGPPFANGVPHYGHLLASTIKDVIPRYKTMQGYCVPRKWGWDCHGLPVENLIEKELNLASKKDIINFGIDKFNQASRDSVMRYADEWRKIVPRMGRFVDMDNDYRTMDASYTESVWWAFKSLFDKGLIYEGFKSMNMCPRCETTLSNFEVAQGYKDITDISVYVKFKIKDTQESKKVIDNTNEGSIYLLAWTTTPWTLPGNVALAVGQEIDYVKVKIKDTQESTNTTNEGGSIYILAKSRLSVLKDKKYEIIGEIKGSDLVGLEYEPLFDYYSSDKTLKNNKNGWKIYCADFVTTEDGTGIVHIAPAFGADDYELLKKYNLPFVQHVSVDGHFKSEVRDFAGQAVKPKPTDTDKFAYQKADIEVIKWLAHNGVLFEKEKLVHSYPHCWRCETPLLNYASSSWFVKVTQIKDKLVKENKKIEWVPAEVGEKRFGNWLEGARDWAISRSRFWGAPIPVWRVNGTNKIGDSEYVVIGSIDDIKKYSKAKNKYFLMRHGESQNNIEDILNSDVSKKFGLTDLGKDQVKKSATKFEGKIDMIFCSPLLRAKQTAEIFADTVGFDKKNIIVDERLIEMNMGELEGKSDGLLGKLYESREEFFFGNKMGVENRNSIKRRAGNFVEELESKYSDKKILVVSHDSPLWMLESAVNALDIADSIKLKPKGFYLGNAEIRKIDFTPLPHNENYELDLHRPYIDKIELKTKNGLSLVRVPDVFDCWFESGSMPYASKNYPFCKNDKSLSGGKVFEPKSGWFKKSKGYPADFIAEGLDQTRGWFYSMLVLGVALFGKSPYKKVVVNGLVLAEDGEKMSKSKKNYPDPMNLIEKYGADSMRFYMLSSPVVHAQDLKFSEKGVDEITKKIVNRLLNVVTFYETYSRNDKQESPYKENIVSNNILDKWIVARLNQTIAQVTDALEGLELDRGTRPILDLVDDLSTWYLRRSRDRFKGDDVVDRDMAMNTTKSVLVEISKLLAPYMPFVAEEIFMKISGDYGKNSNESNSVHLESWPTGGFVDKSIIENMIFVRDISSKALEARTNAKINVRQPLMELRVKNKHEFTNYKNTTDGSNDISNSYIELIKDEVNVKEVLFGVNIKTEVELDTKITPELKEEGMVRELLRAIQDKRKEGGLTVSDRTSIKIETNEEGKIFIEKNMAQIKNICLIDNIKYESVTSLEVKIGDFGMKISL